ncbi:MAG: alanine--tRNA ligase [Magnetococcales bacterium]|nr:alanine--tRNA ligase [Magnetococcales bacterium]
MNASEVRQQFIQFFQRNGHYHENSSSLIPRNDPTLLFTNAGMVQFKNLFLGGEQRPEKRMVTVQKCVRAGGKHNDLENVGRTARHHTFFEMLGNFSFGDYFKEAAIVMAWQFVTEVLALPVERLWVTVYAEDDEAYRIWRHKVMIPSDKLVRIASHDNFWSMGETGPCGPCSEIFYDFGPSVAGGPPGSDQADGDRFVEIWNLVFMQYDRDVNGQLTPLPNPCIDTGAGLERIAAITQGKTSNFETDLFQPIIAATAALAALDPQAAQQQPQQRVSLQVIADHLRATSFLIADGVLPSNEGRGYVLRRIMRRAMRHGRLLGLEEPFFYRLVPTLEAVMGEAYPELSASRSTIAMVIESEEKRFAATLGSGLRLLDEQMARLSPGGVLEGSTLFTLYDTFGFPVDLTEDIARDRQIQIDRAGFERCMAEQRARARAAWVGSGDQKIAAVYHQLLDEGCSATEFLGYVTEQARGQVVALLDHTGCRVDRLASGESGTVLVNQTPFYGESGGQVGDSGIMRWDGGSFEVQDSQKPTPELIAHRGRVVQGQMVPQMTLTLEVDTGRRAAVRWHHSATHLLQYALRQQLGDHVKQAGSLVSADRLRLDFSHFTALTETEIARIEDEVNAMIGNNEAQQTLLMTPEQAIASGAMALFGEKYGSEVRVVRLGPSLELCGGTHVKRTGDIGLFRITNESSVAAGVRRIEAVCGTVARRSFQRDAQTLRQVAERMRLVPSQILDGIEKLMGRQKELESAVERARADILAQQVEQLRQQLLVVAGVPLLAATVAGVDIKGLRDLLDRLKDRLSSAVMVLAAVEKDKVVLIAGVTADLLSDQSRRLHAGDLVRFVSEQVGGKGGGRADMAQGGGTRPEQLSVALAAVPGWIQKMVQEHG